jgi:hypothetical protein
MLKRVCTGAVVALAVAGCGGGARPAASVAPSGGTYTNQVRGYLLRQQGVLQGQGFTRLAAGPVFGSLTHSSTTTHSMTVVSGNQYVLHGACDNDCTDLDLKIYDQTGALLMSDVAIDDHPTLMFSAVSGGTYRVEVIMARCNRNPCYYGVQLLSK